jgi:hypothetical protein
MKPSLVEIFNALARAKGWAQVWAQSNPDYDYRAYKFIKDLDHIGRDLNNSVNGETSFRSSRHWNTLEASWTNLFTMIAIRAAHAERISQQYREYTVPLERYREEVHRVVTELFEKAGPGKPTN